MRLVDSIHSGDIVPEGRLFEDGPPPDPRENARAILARSCGASSAFVRISAVAKALGISSTSIHSQIRQGRFPIPHRRVGHAVLVKFEDLVAWYCESEPPPTSDALPVRSAPKAWSATQRTAPSSQDAEAIENLTLFETSAERSDRIKKSVLAAMERQKRIDAASAGTKAAVSWETPRERAERIHREALAQTKPSRPGRKL